MTDDLIAELLNRDEDFRRIAHGDFTPSVHKRAADRIGQIEAEAITLRAALDRAEADKAAAVDALKRLIDRYDEVVTTPDCSCSQDDHDVQVARKVVAALDGVKT